MRELVDAAGPRRATRSPTFAGTRRSPARQERVLPRANYVAHAEEAARARGQRGEDSRRSRSSSPRRRPAVTGPFDDVPVDRSATQQVDWEVELGAVIGRPGATSPRRTRFEHVFGYTVINDVSARDLQQQHMQWFKGKSLDGFCPMGPVVVTADEFGDPQSKRLQLRVNGVIKQDGTTANMIFPVDVIIEWLSKG